jgi:hypothetical protein
VAAESATGRESQCIASGVLLVIIRSFIRRKQRCNPVSNIYVHADGQRDSTQLRSLHCSKQSQKCERLSTRMHNVLEPCLRVIAILDENVLFEGNLLEWMEFATSEVYEMLVIFKGYFYILRRILVCAFEYQRIQIACIQSRISIKCIVYLGIWLCHVRASVRVQF